MNKIQEKKVRNKIVLYIAKSLDGFIARKNGSVDWLDKFNETGEDYGYKKFLDTVDTLIMGNTTYKQVLGFGEFPYKGKDCYVFSRKERRNKDDNVTFVKGDVNEFLCTLKPKKFLSILFTIVLFLVSFSKASLLTLW